MSPITRQARGNGSSLPVYGSRGEQADHIGCHPSPQIDCEDRTTDSYVLALGASRRQGCQEPMTFEQIIQCGRI